MKLSAAVVSALLVATLLCSGGANADEAPVVGAGSYGQEIIEQALVAHQNITSITLYAKVPGKFGDVVVASNDRRPNAVAPAEVQNVLMTGKPQFRVEGGQTKGRPSPI